MMKTELLIYLPLLILIQQVHLLYGLQI